ncbi:MAG: hypothetical protein SNH94_05690 [Rikenellaceae bacterium]
MVRRWVGNSTTSELLHPDVQHIGKHRDQCATEKERPYDDDDKLVEVVVVADMVAAMLEVTLIDIELYKIPNPSAGLNCHNITLDTITKTPSQSNCCHTPAENVLSKLMRINRKMRFIIITSLFQNRLP